VRREQLGRALSLAQPVGELVAAGDRELLERVRQVRLDRPAADEERLRDPAVVPVIAREGGDAAKHTLITAA
jgi:hypothetical protein